MKKNSIYNCRKSATQQQRTQATHADEYSEIIIYLHKIQLRAVFRSQLCHFIWHRLACCEQIPLFLNQKGQFSDKASDYVRYDLRLLHLLKAADTEQLTFFY